MYYNNSIQGNANFRAREMTSNECARTALYGELGAVCICTSARGAPQTLADNIETLALGGYIDNTATIELSCQSHQGVLSTPSLATGGDSRGPQNRLALGVAAERRRPR